jgi:hypothetical protein
MTPAPLAASMTASPAESGITSWLRRAERWLDDRGKAAWIAATVLAFILAWPVGLGLLAYMIWSKRMFGRSSCAQNGSSHWAKMREHHHSHHGLWGRSSAMRSSGNAAFDAYKSETLRRLEEEQEAFEAFLQRLRDAKDKAEFDSFMEDRARAARAEAVNTAEATSQNPVPPAPQPPTSGGTGAY